MSFDSVTVRVIAPYIHCNRCLQCKVIYAQSAGLKESIYIWKLHLACSLLSLFLLLLCSWTFEYFCVCVWLHAGEKKNLGYRSVVHFTAHIWAVTGVKTNYVSGWKSSYVTRVAVNIPAAAHPMGPESHRHGIISAQIRFIFLQYKFYAPYP